MTLLVCIWSGTVELPDSSVHQFSRTVTNFREKCSQNKICSDRSRQLFSLISMRCFHLNPFWKVLVDDNNRQIMALPKKELVMITRHYTTFVCKSLCHWPICTAICKQSLRMHWYWYYSRRIWRTLVWNFSNNMFLVSYSCLKVPNSSRTLATGISDENNLRNVTLMLSNKLISHSRKSWS